MSKAKKMKVYAEIWGRKFPIELWASSTANAKGEIIKDACKTLELYNNDFKLWGYIFSPKEDTFPQDKETRLEMARKEIKNFLTVKRIW